MAKAIKKYNLRESAVPKVSEPEAMYYPAVQKLPIVADFSYNKFDKIAGKVPVTLKEWANILHLSERTLQRYAKDNKSFEGIYVDRILQIKQLFDMGLETFINGEAFYQWLKKDKRVLGHILTFESLYSQQGIQELIDQVVRIQYGVYI